ncbi:hypothetical protein Ahy_A01g000775 [Arachis hypogaea]|uniref:Uncharacterized protein n=1 Tax=Arachis hypogaea TaxID=3818 RepID=A0A445EL34_ARAHY|nr:hypothetical protein Ahy_A01g000775 [Arachis hypogaea]
MLNQKFSLNHSLLMGPTEIPSQSTETIKIPTANYEFGATFIDHPKLMLLGRILTDGRLNARVKCDVFENLTLKANAQNPLLCLLRPPQSRAEASARLAPPRLRELCGCMQVYPAHRKPPVAAAPSAGVPLVLQPSIF